MNKKILTTIALLLTVALYIATRQNTPSIKTPAEKADSPKRAVTALPIQQSLAALPLRFEPNQGQTDDKVKFLARGQGYSLFLTQAEAVLSLRHSQPIPEIPADSTSEKPTSAVVRMSLIGTDPSALVIGTKKLDGKVNYFLGNDPSCWRRDIPTFAKIVYTHGGEGIDLAYYGNQRQLESDFAVMPATVFPGPVVLPRDWRTNFPSRFLAFFPEPAVTNRARSFRVRL